MVKGTRIVIKARTNKGKRALRIQKLDEEEFRDKYRYIPKWRLPSDVRSYMKTVSLFIPKDDPEIHQILGFKKMDNSQKKHFYEGVKKSFKENKCSILDFEVEFFDE